MEPFTGTVDRGLRVEGLYGFVSTGTIGHYEGVLFIPIDKVEKWLRRQRQGLSIDGGPTLTIEARWDWAAKAGVAQVRFASHGPPRFCVNELR